MFDRYLDPNASRRKRWRTGIVVSASAHAGVGVAVLIATFWNIDKLEPLPATVVQVGLSNQGLPMAEPGGAPPPLRRTAKKQPQKKTRIDGPVQPVANPNPSDDPPPTDGDDDQGSEDGAVDGIAGSKGTVPGAMKGIGPGIGTECIGICIDKIDIPVTTKTDDDDDRETVVPQTLIEGHRVSGDPQIAPPDAVMQQMVVTGQERTRATVKMCLDRAGGVSRLSLVSSSGYDAYDALLLSRMRGWRYEPYEVNGKPVPVCTAVTFIFKLQK